MHIVSPRYFSYVRVASTKNEWIMAAAPTHPYYGLVEPYYGIIPSPPFPFRAWLIVVCGGASSFGVEMGN